MATKQKKLSPVWRGRLVRNNWRLLRGTQGRFILPGAARTAFPLWWMSPLLARHLPYLDAFFNFRANAPCSVFFRRSSRYLVGRFSICERVRMLLDRSRGMGELLQRYSCCSREKARWVLNTDSNSRKSVSRRRVRRGQFEGCRHLSWRQGVKLQEGC